MTEQKYEDPDFLESAATTTTANIPKIPRPAFSFKVKVPRTKEELEGLHQEYQRAYRGSPVLFPVFPSPIVT